MTPNGKLNPEGSVIERIKQDFGDYEKFKKQFTEAAIAVEGSGWTIFSMESYVSKISNIAGRKTSKFNSMGSGSIANFRFMGTCILFKISK